LKQDQKKNFIHELPETIKQSIPLYDPSQIFSIYYNAGQERQKRTELLTFFSKTYCFPLLLFTFHTNSETKDHTAAHLPKKQIFYGFMRTPIGEQKDIYTITWKNLTAEPRFIVEYYKTEMENKDFKLEYDQKNGSLRQMLYSNSSTLVNVIIDGNDEVTVTVTL
jgi:hypothetical protein